MRQNVGVQRVRVARALWGLAAVVTISLLLSWPALLNGGPFFMSDSVSYIRGAASAFYRMFGVKTAWTSEYLRVFGDLGGHPATRAASSTANLPVTLSGRSVYYGALLFLADLAGSLWIVVAIQSTLAAAAVFLTARNIARIMGQEPTWEPLLVGIVAALATPLGYFTGYLMPDVFGGFAVLATANLLFLRAGQSWPATAFWLALLAYSLVAHNANAPIVLAMTLAALIYSRVRTVRIGWVQLAGVAGCLCLAILAQLIFAQSVRTATGAAPVEPPFLAMRLIADGPGYSYLQRRCQAEQYIYCRTVRVGRLPSDILLWDDDPNRSLFRGLSPQEQRTSAAEQPRFIAGVVKDAPLAVLGAAAQNALRQLLDFRLVEFDYGDVARTRFKETIPPTILQRLLQTRAYQGVMPIAPVQRIAAVSALVSLLLLVTMLGSSGAAATRNRDAVRAYCVTILVGIATNAIICGIISGPNGRYEMRLIWTLPVVAASVFISRARISRQRVRSRAALHTGAPAGDQHRASMGTVG